MGPWLVFGALLNRSTMALFQSPPLGRPFGDFVSAARVTMLGVVRFLAGELHAVPGCGHLRTMQRCLMLRSSCDWKRVPALCTRTVCRHSAALVPWVAFSSCLLCGGCQVVQQHCCSRCRCATSPTNRLQCT